MNKVLSLSAAAAILLMLSVGLYAAHVRYNVPRAESMQPSVATAPAAGESGGLAGERLQQEMARLEARLSSHPKDYEARLLKGLLYFKSGKLQDALDELNELTERAPKFKLAHLVQGDLLLSQVRPVVDIGSNPLAHQLSGENEQLHELQEEARVRLEAYLNSLQGRLLPRHLLALGESIETAVVVDKRTHRLFIYRSGDDALELVRDFYVSTGKLMGNKSLRGDLRTPEGVYFVTRYIPGRQLADKYGVGAFPVNYPNELDRRMGKTGGGIWLHGTDRDYYSRPPLDSEGCVVLTNVDLGVAGGYIHPSRTPVVIADGVEWVDRASWREQRREVMEALDQWRRDWQSGDVEAYLSHYSRDFWSKGYDVARWRKRKRLVARGKEYQEIELTDIALLAYPKSATQDRELVVANFQQDYRSNNFSSQMGKRLYLRREEGQWRILYEGRQ